jgi:hypothetical protein
MPITVDEILYASGTNPALLSGTVDMTLTGNLLQVTLTNTSADAAGSGAGILLTGIGFQLPAGISIYSGSATIPLGSTGIGFATSNVSSEWGYDNNPLHSGAFNGDAVLSYTTVVSSMESQTEVQFAAGSVAPPGNLNGPDFGLVSSLETGALGSGVEAIRNSLQISLVLGGGVSIPSNLLTMIQAGNVGLSFGSPGISNLTAVPEPASLSLFGLGLASLAAVVRRRRKRS